MLNQKGCSGVAPGQPLENDQADGSITQTNASSQRNPQALLSRREAPRMPAIRKIPIGVRGPVQPLPDRTSLNFKKRGRRRAWLSQIAGVVVAQAEKDNGHNAWLAAQSLARAIRLYGRKLTTSYLAADIGLSERAVWAALHMLKRAGLLTWSCRPPTIYFNPKMRTTTGCC
jgi:hypothetical protein